MWEMFRQWTPRAREPHVCDWCGETIEAGEVHNAWCGVYEGDFQQNRMHKECHDAFMEYPDEGFRYHENIRGLSELEANAYYDLRDEANITLEAFRRIKDRLSDFANMAPQQKVYHATREQNYMDGFKEMASRGRGEQEHA